MPSVDTHLNIMQRSYWHGKDWMNILNVMLIRNEHSKYMIYQCNVVGSIPGAWRHYIQCLLVVILNRDSNLQWDEVYKGDHLGQDQSSFCTVAMEERMPGLGKIISLIRNNPQVELMALLPKTRLLPRVPSIAFTTFWALRLRGWKIRSIRTGLQISWLYHVKCLRCSPLWGFWCTAYSFLTNKNLKYQWKTPWGLASTVWEAVDLVLARLLHIFSFVLTGKVSDHGKFIVSDLKDLFSFFRNVLLHAFYKHMNIFLLSRLCPVQKLDVKITGSSYEIHGES